MEPMLQGTEKTPALISDYKEYHTDTTVKFVVRMTEEKLAQAEAAGLHKVFKLQSSLTCNSMVRECYLFINFLEETHQAHANSTHTGSEAGDRVLIPLITQTHTLMSLCHNYTITRSVLHFVLLYVFFVSSYLAWN